jgi:hypothetical protein
VRLLLRRVAAAGRRDERGEHDGDEPAGHSPILAVTPLLIKTAAGVCSRAGRSDTRSNEMPGRRGSHDASGALAAVVTGATSGARDQPGTLSADIAT